MAHTKAHTVTVRRTLPYKEDGGDCDECVRENTTLPPVEEVNLQNRAVVGQVTTDWFITDRRCELARKKPSTIGALF